MEEFQCIHRPEALFDSLIYELCESKFGCTHDLEEGQISDSLSLLENTAELSTSLAFWGCLAP